MIHQEEDLLLAAGAALDDLAPDERAAYDAHLRGCRRCAVAEDELGLVLADLLLIVPERTPPADLLAGIRLAIDAERRGEASPPRPATAASAHVASTALAMRPSSTRSLPAPARLRRPSVAVLGLAAAFALVAVGVGVRAAAIQSALDRAQAQVALLREQLATEGGVMAAAMNPGRVTVALHAEPLASTADARVVFVPGTDEAWLVAARLPATRPGEAYQLWHADASGVHPLGVIAYDGSGTFVAELGVALAPGDAVMITLEDADGAAGDPGPQVVFGEIDA